MSLCRRGTSISFARWEAVEDPSAGFEPPPVLSPTPDQNGGRGLFVVDKLTSRWDIEAVQGGGTRVWFEMDCSADS